MATNNQHRVFLLLVTVSVLICLWAESGDATCKTRIIYKTVHVPVHVIKKVPIIKEVKVPVPVYVHKKHHHGHHKEHHHEGHHHDGMHKFGGGGDGDGGFGDF